MSAEIVDIVDSQVEDCGCCTKVSVRQDDGFTMWYIIATPLWEFIRPKLEQMGEES